MSLGFRTAAKRTRVDGINFPSQLEANLYLYLRTLEKAGSITNLELQCRVDPPVCEHCGNSDAPSVKVDFRVYDVQEKRYVYHEAKGVETDRWKAFAKWWRRKGPAPLCVYRSGRNGNVRMVERIEASG